MTAVKSLYVDENSTGEQDISTVHLTDDSISLLSYGLTHMYNSGNTVDKNNIINFLESADGEKFFLFDER